VEVTKPGIVVCSFCLDRFKPCYEGNFTQGIKGPVGDRIACAAAISIVSDRAVICGFYPSDLDCCAYEFDGVPVGFEKADPVCDACFLGFIEQGAVNQIEGDFPFGYTEADERWRARRPVVPNGVWR
jgi:hypothetical protein